MIISIVIMSKKGEMNVCSYGKLKGSIVIEAVIGIMVLSISAMFAINAYIDNCKTIKERILSEDVTRNIESLKREINYNLNKNELDELFKDYEVGFEYNQNFGKDLLNKKLDQLKRGDDIVVKIINRNDENIEFKVNANIRQGSTEVNIKDRFIRSWWIDEQET